MNLLDYIFNLQKNDCRHIDNGKKSLICGHDILIIFRRHRS